MSKFVSIMTNTYSSEITYDEWLKRINNFFFHDKRIVQLLKQNDMTKWTIYKTDVEPLKVLLYVNIKTTSLFMPKSIFKIFTKKKDLIIKTNFARAHVVEDVI